MTDSSVSGPLEEFSERLPLRADGIQNAPDEPGVHVVSDEDGNPLYVGHSAHTRSRLYQHLTGDREASILHGKVGRDLDAELGRTASRDEIAERLNKCTFVYQLTDRPQALKAR